MIGYARVGDAEDQEEQRRQLITLGVRPDRVRFDVGLQGTRHRLPNRDALLDELTSDDTVVVTGLERLVRSAAELGEIATMIRDRNARLNVGGTVYDSATEAGRTAFELFTSVFPDFEAGIYELRLAGPRERAKAAGRYPGGQSKLTAEQRRQLYELYMSGSETIAQMQKRFGLSRSGVYMQIQRERNQQVR
ncbi:recombinase family protein [Rhodococcus rhodochrous]|uniref:Recombinase family protein n=1 Tax=Rhodococcus rhodochrous TaxID=1829 RepID=A0AA47AER0_RHORH|nr:recombinase family protein [Rhodococcus rhodochrous]UZF48515.1 recombinase family protein [Rhodococcus rhodochrous]